MPWARCAVIPCFLFAAAALAGCSQNQPTGETPLVVRSQADETQVAEPRIGPDTVFTDVNALVAAMNEQGVTCDPPSTPPGPAGGSASMLWCLDGSYGGLTLMVFPSGTQPQAALKNGIACAPKGFEEYATGGNWAVLPADMQGNAATQELAQALNAHVWSFCNGVGMSTPQMSTGPVGSVPERNPTEQEQAATGMAKVPKVVGLQESVARKQLTEVGLVVQVVAIKNSEIPDSSVHSGTVLAQSPPAGERVSLGSLVTVTVSTQ